MRFGGFELDPGNFVLRRRGEPVAIERTALELLALLTEHPGELVTYAQAAARIWGADVHVEVGPALYTAVKKIRQALGDNARQPRYVATVARKGYRFVAAVSGGGSGARPEPKPARTMVAVLPFANLSRQADQDYFSDGLTEELITELGRLASPQLGVLARASSMRYRQSRRTPVRIARELGADYLITGSVRRAGGRVRIAVQLLHGSDGTQMWAAAFERPLREVLRVQREVACTAADQIRVRLGPVRAAAEVDPEIYDLYLRGRFLHSQLVPPALRAAIACFEQVLARQSDYAPAWAGLAECHVRLPITSDVPPLEAFPLARRAVERALTLDPGHSQALAVRAAQCFWHAWDWSGCEAATQAAEAGNPSLPEALLYRAHLHSNLGRHGEALEEILRAKRLDPFSRIISALHGEFLYHAGPAHHAAAARQLQGALLLDRRFWVAHINRAKLLGVQGDHRGAVAAANRAGRFSHGNGEALAMAGWSLARAGRRGEAREQLRELERRQPSRYVPPVHRAMILAGLGEHSRALDALEQGLAERDVRLTFLRVETRWNPLRDSSRFQSLLAAVGLAG